MAMLAQGCALGAMRTQIDGGVKHRLLAHPNTIFHHRVHSAANRAMRTDGALDFDRALADGHFALTSVRLLHQRELRSSEADANAQTRAAQKRATVHRGQGLRHAALQAVHEGRAAQFAGDAGRFFSQQHGRRS